MDSSNIRHCAHCRLPYDWRRSASSSLKMTYCGTLCEKADLGFTIETLLHDVVRSAFGQFVATELRDDPELVPA
jgi:hypothetical protein